MSHDRNEKVPGEYTPHDNSTGFNAWNTDPRHRGEAWLVPQWRGDDNEAMMRSFHRWKGAYPADYAHINNLYGDAESWYYREWETIKSGTGNTAAHHSAYKSVDGDVRGGAAPSSRPVKPMKAKKPPSKIQAALSEAYKKHTGTGLKVLTGGFIVFVSVIIASLAAMLLLGLFIPQEWIETSAMWAGTASLITIAAGILWTIIDAIKGFFK